MVDITGCGLSVKPQNKNTIEIKKIILRILIKKLVSANILHYFMKIQISRKLQLAANHLNISALQTTFTPKILQSKAVEPKG